jgi:hypothetical protein
MITRSLSLAEAVEIEERADEIEDLDEMTPPTRLLMSPWKRLTTPGWGKGGSGLRFRMQAKQWQSGSKMLTSSVL